MDVSVKYSFFSSTRPVCIKKEVGLESYHVHESCSVLSSVLLPDINDYVTN